MSRQDDACWRCGTQWSAEGAPRTALRLIRGGASDPVASAPQSGVAAMAMAIPAPLDAGGEWR